MLLFRSEDHVERWRNARGINRGVLLPMVQQWQLAKSWYSDRMSESWRRRSPEEAEKVFASVGLKGEFWRLR